MNYNIQYENTEENLLTRLLKIRNIDESIDSFLNPKFSEYWLNPFLLNDMEKAVNRLLEAVKNNEKIMVFGDYDVDGVTSSYMVYQYFKKYLKYKNISIKYPSRLKDGYGLKSYHIDEMKAKDIDVIVTVDNGITSLKEADYAKEVGIDLIITDHHQDLENIPNAFAVVNPQVSPDYPFKGLAGVGVAFKLVCALLEKGDFDDTKKQDVFNYFLPIVTIGTVADIVPLVHENRVIVKRGLALMNNHRHKIPSSLRGFLEFLNIKKNIDTFHIGFMIGPRINAGGRIDSPYESLFTLLYSGDKQKIHLEQLDEINNRRKKLQEKAYKEAEEMLSHDHNILIAMSEEFHEGIVGIVSGRITEKYNKPSIILKIDKEKGEAVASLRGPSYFSVIDMLKAHEHLLIRFGGHKQAGGLSIKIENLQKLKEECTKYCQECVSAEDLIKSISIDTKIYPQERSHDTLVGLEQLGPFGEGNPEPKFLLENILIEKIEKVGNSGKGHIKLHGKFGENKVNILFRSKGEEKKTFDTYKDTHIHVIGKVKKDTFNGGYYVDGMKVL